MVKQVDLIDYKNLSENLLNYLCDRDGVTETIILLLEQGYSYSDLYSLFPDEEVYEAIDEYEKRIQEEQNGY